MTIYCQESVEVSDISQIGEVRRLANRLAASSGLNESDVGKVAIIASELATNLVRYAQAGEMLLRSAELDGAPAVELLSIDRGPGMANVDRCIEDGFSSGGTPGNGLGAVRRMASEFDIFSTAPGGTVVLARVGQAAPVCSSRFEWGIIHRPAPRELVCGDCWRIAQLGPQMSLMIADGLGHGVLAAEAAVVAADVFDRQEYDSVTDFLTVVDRRMRGTRGAAVAIAQMDRDKSSLEFAGVGNIAGSLRSRRSLTGRGLVSHNGTVGVEMRKVQRFEYEYPADSLLIMHSDGLQARWSLEKYPQLADRHPAIVAGVLYRDFRRGHDDVTVGVVRCSARIAA